MNLARKLRLRFFFISAGVLLALLALIVLFTVFQSYRNVVSQADRLLERIADGEEPSEDARYFSVTLIGNELQSVETVQLKPVRRSQAALAAKKVLSSGNGAGFYEGYRYLVRKNGDTALLLFLYREGHLDALSRQTLVLILTAVSGYLLMLIVLFFTSRAVVRPMAESYRKQKEFITAAGHELKTPVTVILADTAMAESTLGKNEWTEDLRKQADQLTSLTEELITLARMEEDVSRLRVEFPVSDLAEETSDSFRAVSLDRGIRFTKEITPGLSYVGEEESIRKLFSILLDNAFKYTAPGGSVVFSLEKSGGLCLRVTNTVQDFPEEALLTLFDRFKRGPGAEGQRGFGIGLSTARAITEHHRGKISAFLPDREHLTLQAVLH